MGAARKKGHHYTGAAQKKGHHYMGAARKKGHHYTVVGRVANYDWGHPGIMVVTEHYIAG